MADLGISAGGALASSRLMQILQQDEIVPGAGPSYELCKTIYSYHPLGAKMADAPIDLAQSMARKWMVRSGPEHDLVQAFQREWFRLGVIGGDRLVRNVFRLSRVYGIASLVVGTRGEDPSEPINFWRDADKDLYFNVLDPLNTAGSLVLDQDPNSPDFLKPRHLQAGPQVWHPSRAIVMVNDDPIYIEWTNSAFGFVGRSVYQRALYPLKSYINTLIADDMIVQKSGVIVFKQKGPGSIIDRIAQAFAAAKRTVLKLATIGNIVTVGTDEDAQSLNLQNLDAPYDLARNNILKNIATAANMPASLLNNETLTKGFGEGSEDAKNIARFIDGIRTEMKPVYDYLDRLTMHRAWDERFYRTIQAKYPEYRDVPYQTAFLRWRDAYEYEWPNLLVEPDSELVKREASILEAAIGIFEVTAPVLDPVNKAEVVEWIAAQVNAAKMLQAAPLNIDMDALVQFAQKQDQEADMLAQTGGQVPGTGEAEGEPQTRAAYDV